MLFVPLWCNSGLGFFAVSVGCDRARAEALGPQPDRGKGFALRGTGTQGRSVSTVRCAVWGCGLCACCWWGVAASCGVVTLAWYLLRVGSVDMVITAFSCVGVLAGADHRQPHRRQRPAPSHPRRGREDHRGVPAAHEPGGRPGAVILLKARIACVLCARSV
jgi:hypothetical protein